jgi:hypothetical protein
MKSSLPDLWRQPTLNEKHKFQKQKQRAGKQHYQGRDHPGSPRRSRLGRTASQFFQTTMAMVNAVEPCAASRADVAPAPHANADGRSVFVIETGAHVQNPGDALKLSSAFTNSSLTRAKREVSA